MGSRLQSLRSTFGRWAKVRCASAVSGPESPIEAVGPHWFQADVLDVVNGRCRLVGHADHLLVTVAANG